MSHLARVLHLQILVDARTRVGPEVLVARLQQTETGQGQGQGRAHCGAADTITTERDMLQNKARGKLLLWARRRILSLMLRKLSGRLICGSRSLVVRRLRGSAPPVSSIPKPHAQFKIPFIKFFPTWFCLLWIGHTLHPPHTARQHTSMLQDTLS